MYQDWKKSGKFLFLIMMIICGLFTGPLRVQAGTAANSCNVKWKQSAKKTIEIRPGETGSIPVEITKKDRVKKVTWRSSDKSIASVNSSTGKITGKKPGKAVITVTVTWDNNVKKSITRKIWVKIRILIGGHKNSGDLLTKYLEGENVMLYFGTTKKPELFDALILPPGIIPGRDKETDRRQKKLIEMFVEEDKPVLGVCRGMELLTLKYGGKLNKKKDIDIHHKDNADGSGYRIVSPEKKYCNDKNSVLYGTANRFLTLHSHSKYCVKVPKGFVVTARDVSDGTIEAIQHKTKHIYGIQWHPELGIYRDSNNAKIFNNFIRIACRDAARRGKR